MDIINIKLDFGSTKLDVSFEPTKANVVALFAFVSSQIAMNEDDQTADVIAGLSGQLKDTTDRTEKALGEL